MSFNMNGRSGKSTINEDYIMEAREIRKIADCIGESFRIWGFCITKDAGYGKGVLLCADQCLLSLPKRYVEVYESFTADDIQDIKSGNVYVFDIKKLEAKKPGQRDTITFEMEKIDDGKYQAWLKAQGEANITNEVL